MKEIKRDVLINDIKRACIEANLSLPCDVKKELNHLEGNEINPRAKSILNQIEQNVTLAKKESIPMCQDTGIMLAFVKIGNQVKYDFDLYKAINQGVREAYQEGNLRKSVVSDPLKRINSGDNTPAVIHVELSNDDTFEILLAPKGAGSENMSQLKMFNPQTPIDEIKTYILNCVINAKGKPCPPIIVGVGIGGTFEKAALMAKQAILKPIGLRNEDELYADIERSLIEEINKTGIGPMGLGGNSTCMDVKINQYASHIASLAVAVNIQCHVARHKVVSY